MKDLKGFKILQFEDVQDQLGHIHKHGYDAGRYVGFPSFKEHYSMLPGSCTDWTGYPQSGKSELMLEMLFNMTHFYGWKHMLFVPDIGASVDVMIKLIHKETGQTFKKKYPNYIDIKKAFNSCSMLMESFKIIHRTSYKEKLTPVEFWEFAAEYKKEHGLDTAVIDSWKDLHHDYTAHGGSYAPYLSYVLPVRNEIAERSGLHFHTVVHPKNPQRDKNRKIYPPFPDDIEGGAQWNNSGKSMIVVHRENFDNRITDVYFRKIKPESVGRATNTAVSLEFDIAKSRYYWLDHDHSRVYAEKEYREDYKPVAVQQTLVDYTEPRKETEEAPF